MADMTDKEIKKEFEIEEKEEKKPSWEILNEQKEALLNVIKENPEILDTQILKPSLVYPDLQKYEVNGMNNLMLSTVAIENRYADNTWIMADTVKNTKYTDKDGQEKQAFYLKKGEKATKVGIEVKEKNVQDPITGSWYKEKLDKPYVKNVNVYNLSQFSFAKDMYPQKTYAENKKKDYITLSPEKVEELNKNTFEAKIEKFFIEQNYNIKNREEIKPIDREELKNNIENTKTHDGKLHTDSYRMEYFPGKAMGAAKKTIGESKIEKAEINKEQKKEGKSEKVAEEKKESPKKKSKKKAKTVERER